MNTPSYRPNAPTDTLTFSHDFASWMASWFGQWLPIGPDEARALFDKGWTLLDEL